jgi:hydroxypyruvate reductase
MLAESARKIFSETLLRIDAKQAVQRAVKLENSKLLIRNNEFEIDAKLSIYVIAIGKAAYPMAVGFDEIAGEFIKGGVVSGVLSENKLNSKWQVFAGGHPLPNEASFASAKVAFELLKKADSERALVVFLISGGGSAMMELPRSEEISLADLQEFNQILVTSGANIAEINSVRRAISQVKGGGLALSAPNSKQISLIISDTSAGDVSSVASGPSLLPDKEIPDVDSVIAKYNLAGKFPVSINLALKNSQLKIAEKLDSQFYVLLDNEQMIQQAAQIAEKIGFIVKIDKAAEDEFIVEGCENLLSRFVEFRQSVAENSSVCFISGGEFGCKVVGNGIGGRNSETVLRLSLLAQNEKTLSEFAILSAGTDGIDGNSPAAGSGADETTLQRAKSQKMNPLEYLQNSDSFSFFNNLGDSIITGATGTNVRDIRILMA